MTSELTILTVKAQETTGYGIVYRVAYDGRCLGDDRGFSTEMACDAEISKRVAQDHSDAIRFNRPVRLVKR